MRVKPTFTFMLTSPNDKNSPVDTLNVKYESVLFPHVNQKPNID